MLIHDHLRRSAEVRPDKVGLISGSTRLTFGQLWDLSGRFAWHLVERGVAPGDRVAVFGSNRWQTAVACFGALRAGAVAMPINPQTKAHKLRYLLADATPACLVADGGLVRVWLPVLEAGSNVPFLVTCGAPAIALPARLAGVTLALEGLLEDGGRTVCEPAVIDQDLAAIIYTSGSTGDPKGVMLTHLNMVAALEAVSSYLGVKDGDTIGSALSLSYSYGLYQLLLATKVGATLLLEPGFTFPVQVLADLERERATVFPAVPSYFSALREVPNFSTFKLDGIRIVTSAAAPLAACQLAEARTMFPGASFFCMYGLTECKRVSYLAPEELDAHLGSVGKGMPNQEVYLVDDAGCRLPVGSVGELVVRGSHVMRGYWRKPKETAERLRPGRYPGEPALFTGDIFRTDRDGYLYFVSRKDDIIKCGGEKVSPCEVENVIMDLQTVLEAAVIGIPDALLGQAVQAFVVTRAGALTSAEDIIRHCRGRLEATHVPKYVKLVSELPRTNSGKTDKRALRAPFQEESEERRV